MNDRFTTEAIVEIPQGSRCKYEFDKTLGVLKLDRLLPSRIPYNYGYIDSSFAYDGDCTDVCIIGNFSIHPLTLVNVCIIGAFECIDNGVPDDKLVGYVVGDTLNSHSLELGKGTIHDYLSTYKDGFVVTGFVGPKEALEILESDRERYRINYGS